MTSDESVKLWSDVPVPPVLNTVGSRGGLVEKACQVCGIIFQVKRHRASDARFCSRKCKGAAKCGLGKHHNTERFQKTCATCGATFTVPTCRKDKAKYCSAACHNGQRPKQLTRLCNYCGKPYSLYVSEDKIGWHRHCSNKCWRLDVASDLNLAKARGQCDRCGWKEEPLILEIHHKDRNRKNNTAANLELLCSNCHLLEHFRAGDGPFHRTGSKDSGYYRRRRSLSKLVSEQGQGHAENLS